MRRALLLAVVAACGFEGGALRGDARTDAPADACVANARWWDAAYAQRARVDLAGAPAGYTLRLEAGALVAAARAASADDLRAVVDDGTTFRELDRVVDPPFVELRAPATGTLWLYAGNAAATAPPADRAAIFRFAENFDGLTLGGSGDSRFDPRPGNEWMIVAADAGGHSYRATGTGRHPAAIKNVALAHGELRARIRTGAGGVQNHNGLAVRATNLQPATMDGFVAQVLEDSDRSRIAEYQDGVSPPVEHAVHPRPVDRATWYVVRVRFVGELLELYVDGALEASHTAPTIEGTALGLFVHDCDVEVDDVWLREATAPEPAAQVTALEARCP